MYILLARKSNSRQSFGVIELREGQMASLGKLEKVDLREGWETEPQDFTPWLAREENLEELGRAIGLELEVVAQEQHVGPYRADLVCKDAVTQGYVLIEN